jgi:hypothetical protein
MAAIGPHVEQYESTEEELEYAECSASSGLSGLDGARKKKCPSPESIVGLRHGGLVRMAMTRQELLSEIKNFSYRVQMGDGEGKRTDELFLILGKNGAQSAIGTRGPEWNAHSTMLGLKGFHVLSWTSKMDAPSFSLPAGSAAVGGACPGAVAGQTTDADNGSLIPMASLIRQKTGYANPPDDVRWYADSICQSCYAEKGNYYYSSKQLGGMLIYQWVRQSLRDNNGEEFVRLMIQAINLGQVEGHTYPPLERPRKMGGYPYKRFFRIHDAGDFFSPPYIAAWKRIANAFLPGNRYGHEPILFWAPSRIWATPWGVKAVNQFNTPIGNLIIRPSAYHTNTDAFHFQERGQGTKKGLGTGWSAGSAVTPKDNIPSQHAKGAFQWNCPAYDGAEKVSCLSAPKGPDGKPTCRACWVMPEMTINYKFH